jgi:hypothetical protein
MAIPDEMLAEIEKRLDAATTGPWKSYVENRDMVSGSDVIMTGGEDPHLSGATIADQDFIAAARQDVAMLVMEVRRLRALMGPP